MTETASRRIFRTFAGLAAFAAVGFAPTFANAVVYCKTVGVPKGCVAAPVVRVAPVVATPRIGVVAPRYVAPRYGVGVGAPGVGVRPGTPANRGGPVNRVGRR